MNLHAKAHLEQIVKRATGVRAEIAQLANDVAHTPMFRERDDPPIVLADLATALTEAGEAQAMVVADLMELLEPGNWP